MPTSRTNSHEPVPASSERGARMLIMVLFIAASALVLSIAWSPIGPAP
jgi:hypothetical protein